MEYMRIDIMIPSEGDPKLVVSEIDAQYRIEVRRVAHFPDGRIECASEDTETCDTQLSVPAIPTLDEMQAQGSTEWTARTVTREEFEAFWKEPFERQTR